ncbi:hypothetical protein D9M68_624880 [compost metagenome]
MLDDGVAVRHGQGVGVADVDLFLPRPPLPFRILHRYPAGLQVLADRPQHRFLAGGLEDAVVLDEMRRGLRMDVVALVDGLVALVEEVELQFRGEHAHIATLGEPRHLLAENGTRAVGQILAVVMIQHIAEHQRRAVQPGHPAQGAQVGLEHEVAVSLAPARRGVARHRLHVDVVGQQVIAAMRLLEGAVDEEFRLEAFADQSPLHVHHAGQHRVDLAAGNGLLEFVEAEERFAHGAVLWAGNCRKLSSGAENARLPRTRAVRTV